MPRRLLVLLAITVASGTVAGFVGNATAGKGGSALVAPKRPPVAIGKCPIPDKFRAAFVQASHQTRLPLAMLTAVAQVESEFVEDARSPAGAQGLLQVMPTTAAEFDLDARNTKQNVLAGATYLRQLLDRFDSTDLALAAYNAGPEAVVREGRAPAVTLGYIADVTRLWRAYNGCR